MRKTFMLFAALVCGLIANAKTVYFNPDIWKVDEPEYFVHSWTGTDTNVKDFKMNFVSDGIYSVDVPDGNENIIFVRMPKGSQALDWKTKWNQTSDLKIPSDKNQYNITGWKENDGTWSVYSGSGNQGGGNQGGGNQGGGNDGGNQGGNQGGGTASTMDYYLKGYRGKTSKDIETPTAEELFEGGKLTYTFEGDDKGLGYFFIMACEPGQVIGQGYMLKEYTDASHATLYYQPTTGASQKLGVKAGTVTFYLYDNGDGTLELSTEPLSGKTLVGGGSGDSGSGSGETQPGGEDKKPDNQAVENTPVVQKAHKVFVDGQLRIIRGDMMFDATGRKL